MAEKKTIFLIEDDLATMDVYKTVLEKAGFKVIPFFLGSEIIKKLKEIEKKEKPEVILLDLILPDISGFKILEEIRKNEATKNIPVLILTNYSDSESRQKGLKLKTEKYLLKTDYTPSQLIKIIKDTLGR